ncbi:hypothetical protein BS47DRAFT_1290612, partial [Hydnum rufescens UP504]
GSKISVHHIDGSTCPQALVDFLHGTLEAELDRGLTYPHEYPIGAEGFVDYFFGGDVFLGIAYMEAVNASEPSTLEEALAGRALEDCVAGAYYIKPNYPGRSSHICNGGFLVPSSWRGKRYGLLLAKSYLHYAPQLGYRASVFNLVFKNNLASIAIWDRLGFQRTGLIPEAGRLKKSDGTGEEYVDAIVYYKSFVEDASAEHQ